MSLNWKEIDLILSELSLEGSRVQKIRQTDYKSLIIDLYRPGDPFPLFFCMDQGAARFHRLTKAVQPMSRPPRFAEFLRSRIGGGRITEAYQVEGQRIVKISVERSSETTVLWIRLWGGSSNIIATDDQGTILDAMFRRPKSGEVSGGRFPIAAVQAKREGKSGKDYECSVRDLPGAGSFNERVEAYYVSKTGEKTREELKAAALQSLSRQEVRIRSTLEQLAQKLATYEKSDQYKQYGDIITAHLYRMQKGERWLHGDGDTAESGSVDIELDPLLSPAENAQAYYEKHKKAKAGIKIIRDEIVELESELERVMKEKAHVSEETDIEKLKRLIEKQTASAQERKKAKIPGMTFYSHGFTILVGKSGKENDELLRKHVRGNDFWLHTRDFPGAYVFIKNKPGKSIPLDTLLDAGNLALFYSKGRNSGQGELYYTQVKYLRRAKDGKTGLVLPTQEKNLSVRLDPARIERLQNSEEDS